MGVMRTPKTVQGLTPPGSPTLAEYTQTDRLRPSDSPVTLPATEVLPLRRRAIPKQRVALAVGGTLLMLLAAMVYRIQTDQGTLVVTIEDPAVKAILEKGGLVIQDKNSGRDWTIKAAETKSLPSGEYQLKASKQLLVTDDSGVELTTDTFTLKRKDEVRVTIALEPLAAAAVAAVGKAKGTAKSTKLPTTTAPHRRAAEYVLSIGGQIMIRENDRERTIQALADLPKTEFELTGVILNQNAKLTDAGLENFAGCRNIKYLSLGGSSITDAGLVHFKHWADLEALLLSGVKVGDEGLANFANCPHLKRLHLDSMHSMTDAGLAAFKNCSKLEFLILNYNGQIGDAGLANFRNCSGLKTLGLIGVSITDAGMARFRDWPELQTVVMQYDKVGDAGVAHLKDCKNLSFLALNGTLVTDAGLVHLKDSQNLTTLDLSDTQVTDAGLAHLKGLQNLAELTLVLTQVTDAGLAHLKDCQKLIGLNLNDTRVTDAGLAHLKDHKNLRNLLLSNTRVTDAGLAHLKNCTNLSWLILDGTRISDAGLEVLMALPNLHQHYGLHLRHCRVSRYAYEQYKLEKPTVQTTWSEPNRTAAEQVLALGGTVEIGAPGQAARPIHKGDPLPDTYFQVRRISLKDNQKPLGELFATLALLTFAELDRLEAIDLSGNPLQDIGFLAVIQGLHDLTLTNTGIGDDHIAKLPKLRRLVLDGNDIRTAGLSALHNQPELTDLSLGCQTITDFSAKHFVEMKQLKRLSLAGSGLSDAGIKTLSALTNLESLDLRRTKATAAGINDLQTALPKCKIQWDEKPAQ